MDEKNFAGLMEGLQEAVAFARGEDAPGVRVHIPAEIDVKAIRSKLGLSQAVFAKTYGLPAANVRDWEQGRRMPDQAARVLLRVIATDPDAVTRALEHV